MSDPARALRWRKRCGTGACVEFAQAGERVHVRNSTDPDGPQLIFAAAEWRAFLTALKAGRLLASV